MLWRLKDPTERDTAPGAHQSSRLTSLGVGNQVDRTDLVIVAPPTPIPPVSIQGIDFSLGKGPAVCFLKRCAPEREA